MGKPGTILAVVTSTAICLALSWGCSLSDLGQFDADNESTQDAVTATDTVVFLDDVTILRDNGYYADTPAAVDTTVDLDATVVASDATMGDEGARDVVDMNDASAPDVPADGTEQVNDAADDTGNDISALRLPCVDADTDCPEGYTCESTAKDGSYCRPPQNCSLDGLTTLEGLIAALLVDVDGAPIFVKMAVTVDMGPKTCSMEECTAANKCCRSCTASMIVADAEIPIVIRGNDITLGCAGHESSDGSWCSELECAPLMPNETYVIWGSIRKFHPLELAMDGFCPLSDAQPAVD